MKRSVNGRRFDLSERKVMIREALKEVPRGLTVWFTITGTRGERIPVGLSKVVEFISDADIESMLWTADLQADDLASVTIQWTDVSKPAGAPKGRRELNLAIEDEV